MTISGELSGSELPVRYRVLVVEGDSYHERLIEAPDALAAVRSAEEPDSREVTHLLVMPEHL